MRKSQSSPGVNSPFTKAAHPGHTGFVRDPEHHMALPLLRIDSIFILMGEMDRNSWHVRLEEK
ncbi:hypothetical protein DAMNIGENAA_22510 [Desulforhabdus amnigena]|jgi:hypothetical protein|uniref:Uncharacterized protein n=1 Tax=Desulforhabdus amnigena TaxID=40218 RepID=A0A9W6FT45_9BACT|nr:hypothetical protein DAMNIGENAA_22510 [Desulforhabdus amnigena]